VTEKAKRGAPGNESAGIPQLPAIRLEQRADRSPPGDGFLRLVRRELVAHYPDGSASAPFLYDEIDRTALDAVVIVAHHAGAHGREVWLRSAVRPPVTFRRDAEPGAPAGLWEMPAGLVEPHEGPDDRERRAARRELAEELGFEVPLEALTPLGPPTFPSPGITAERHHYFAVEVDPARRAEPSLDGSPLEHLGRVVSLRLVDALELCRSGTIEDAKTELALRRLAERWP
jgi:ADP-ribose pyrophosphatase